MSSVSSLFTLIGIAITVKFVVDHCKEIIRLRNEAEHYPIDEYIFVNKDNACDVLDRLRNLSEKYGYVTIADYYRACKKEPNYFDAHYGWRKLDNATVESYNFAYRIAFPKPERIVY